MNAHTPSPWPLAGVWIGGFEGADHVNGHGQAVDRALVAALAGALLALARPTCTTPPHGLRAAVRAVLWSAMAACVLSGAGLPLAPAHGQTAPAAAAQRRLHLQPDPARRTTRQALPPVTGLTAEALELLTWIRRTADHRSQPFVIIDKRQAQLWLFDANAALTGSTPVLLGSAQGDHAVPGIGERPLSLVKPAERTTPAGRFQAEAGHNAQGEDIFWVDYGTAVSMHRVRPKVLRERRLERLASATPADNRISYGCINVPVGFYDRRLKPAFSTRAGVVYVLPEQTEVRSWLPQSDAHVTAAPEAPGPRRR